MNLGVNFFKIPVETARKLLEEKTLLEEVEQRLGVKVEIDPESGGVKVTYEPQKAENFILMKKVFDALNAGFYEEVHELLTNENYDIEIVDLTDYIGKSKNDLVRVKGRIIGEKGKAKANIENYTKCKLSVYENKVGILGPSEFTTLAKEAVEKLIKGYQHSTVYKFLDSKLRRMKEDRKLWESEKYF
ncbi:MAG: KH domain-containing protein [Thermoproteota archaeon]|jgi:ribosomal RNA assembly protein